MPASDNPLDITVYCEGRNEQLGRSFIVRNGPLRGVKGSLKAFLGQINSLSDGVDTSVDGVSIRLNDSTRTLPPGTTMTDRGNAQATWMKPSAYIVPFDRADPSSFEDAKNYVNELNASNKEREILGLGGTKAPIILVSEDSGPSLPGVDPVSDKDIKAFIEEFNKGNGLQIVGGCHSATLDNGPSCEAPIRTALGYRPEHAVIQGNTPMGTGNRSQVNATKTPMGTGSPSEVNATTILRARAQADREAALPKAVQAQNEIRKLLDTYITRITEANENKGSFFHQFWVDSKQRHFSRNVNLEFAQQLRDKLGSKNSECKESIDIDKLRENAWKKVSDAEGWAGVEHRSARNSTDIDRILNKLDEAKVNGHLTMAEYNSPALR